MCVREREEGERERRGREGGSEGGREGGRKEGRKGGGERRHGLNQENLAGRRV